MSFKAGIRDNFFPARFPQISGKFEMQSSKMDLRRSLLDHSPSSLKSVRHGKQIALLGSANWLRAKIAISTLCLLYAACASLYWKSTIDLHFDPCEKSWRMSDEESENPRKVESDNAAIAADEGRCSDIGIQTLKDGGNAIDAAVSVSFCLGVLNAMASGIGGGNFILIRLANGTTDVIDGRETAPAAASEDMYRDKDASQLNGALSLAVPGELASLHLAWQRHGRLPWLSLVQPAVHLARSGFEVSQYLAASIQGSAEAILSHASLRSVYAPHGRLLLAGDLCYNGKLADTLELIGREGPSVFYRGRIGSDLVADVQVAGGILTAGDMAAYRATLKDAVVGDAFGLSFVGFPPPSSGGPAIIEMFKILHGYWQQPASDALQAHRTVEAMKHAFALRMNLGDPAFVDDSGVLQDMLSDSFASALRGNISDNTTFPPGHYGGKWNQLNDNGTSHFCIVDPDRNAVSVTSTVNLGFGSKFMSASTGVLLNDEMGDFSRPDSHGEWKFPPSPANFIRPGKRPLSSMAPFVVLQDGQLRAVVGGSGGTFIISSTAQVLLNYFLKGMSPLQAVDAPRLHHQLVPNHIYFEANHSMLNGDKVSYPNDVLSGLIERGHLVQPLAYGGVVQLIVQDLGKGPVENGVIHGRLTAVSDARKDGKPAGW